MEITLKNVRVGKALLTKLGAFLCGIVFVSGNLFAQEAVPPDFHTNLMIREPTVSTTPDVTTSDAPPETGYVPLESAGTTKPAWDFAAELQTHAVYEDNIFISHFNRQSDLQLAIVPMIAFGWGDVQGAVHQEAPFPHRFAEAVDPGDIQNLILVRYALTALFFDEHTEENSLDHDASALFRWHFSKLNLNFGSRYQTLSSADLDIGTRVDRTFADSTLRATYEISEKTSVETNLITELRDYETGITAVTFQNENFFDYQIRPKTRLGVGIGVGRLDYDRGADQNFGRGLMRLRYSATDKLSIGARAGYEYRQFDDGREGSEPIFGLGATYSPFDSTSISLEAFRHIKSAAQITRSNVTETSFSIGVQQRFYQFLYLTVAAGYANGDYEVRSGVIAPQRNDDVVYIYPSLGFDITRHASFQVGYRYQQDRSTLEQFSFTANQASVQLNLSY